MAKLIRRHEMSSITGVGLQSLVYAAWLREGGLYEDMQVGKCWVPRPDFVCWEFDGPVTEEEAILAAQQENREFNTAQSLGCHSENQRKHCGKIEEGAIVIGTRVPSLSGPQAMGHGASAPLFQHAMQQCPSSFDPATCDECYGTGFFRGYGAPCPRGCKHA